MKRKYNQYVKANAEFNKRYDTTSPAISYETWLKEQSKRIIGNPEAAQ